MTSSSDFVKAYASVDRNPSDPTAKVMMHVSPKILSVFADEVRRAYQAGLDKGRQVALREIENISKRDIQSVGGGGNGGGDVGRGNLVTGTVDADVAGSSGTRATDATGAGEGASEDAGSAGPPGYQAALRERRARRRLQALSGCAPY